MKRWIGFLGDQTLYTHLAARPGVGGMVYTLPCEWNRQLSMQFGFRSNASHFCPRRCALLHANFRPLKCAAARAPSVLAAACRLRAPLRRLWSPPPRQTASPHRAGASSG